MFNDSSVDSYLFSSEFFSQFERESEKKYLFVENDLIFIDECVHPSRNKSFERWIKCAQKNSSDDFDMPYNFKQITNRLSKSKATTNRRNADLREFQIFKNCFLVKKFFTTGFKKVKPNELHVLTATSKNLHIFFPKSEMNLEDGTFDAKTEYLYDKYSLAKYTKLVFIPGQEYIVVSPDKCFFFFEIQPAVTPQENPLI